MWISVIHISYGSEVIFDVKLKNLFMLVRLVYWISQVGSLIEIWLVASPFLEKEILPDVMGHRVIKFVYSGYAAHGGAQGGFFKKHFTFSPLCFVWGPSYLDFSFLSSAATDAWDRILEKLEEPWAVQWEWKGASASWRRILMLQPWRTCPA